MPLNFNLPTTGDAYAGVPTTLREQNTALAQMLDPSYAGTLTATPTGAKRLNSGNGLVEQFNGTSWVEWAAAWLKRSGGQMTGTLDMGGNQALLASTPAVNSAWFTTAPYATGQGDNRTHFGYRTSGGVYENYIRGAVSYFAGDVRIGGDLFPDSGIVVSGVGPGGFAIDTSISSRIANTLVVGVNVDEGIRMVGNGAFLSAYNAGNSLRTGYLQFDAANGEVWLSNERSGSVTIGTNATWRWRFDVGGSLLPLTDNAYSIGSGSLRPSNAYLRALDLAGRLTSDQGEAARFNNNGGFLSGWNTAGSVRTGYVQFNAGADVRVVSETADLFLSANTRAYIGIGGSVRFQQTANLADFKGCAVRTEPVTVAFAQALSINVSQGNYFEVGTITANITSISLSNAAAGQWVRLRFKHSGTHTITTGSMGGVNPPAIAGSPNTAAGKVSYLDLTYNVADSRWEGAWLKLP